MGRAMRAAGPASARSSERSKKIGNVRTKRKKRKRELEELHRNVLEAKRNTAGVNEAFEDGKSRRKTRNICERLLPEPMLGIYQNGAKGREICRAVGRLNETNAARLRGEVLKLLKGDETNPKSSWDRQEHAKKKIANPVRPSDDSDDTDCENVIRYLGNEVPGPGNVNGIKRMNHGKMKIEAKDRQTEVPRQRDEAKCKRRLFESDEKDEPAKNTFGIIDRTMITDHEIRFSPVRTKTAGAKEKSKIGDHNSKNRNSQLTMEVEQNDEDDDSGKNSILNKASFGNNFWGWSPVTCYERLCAMISIDNFENKSRRRQKGPDPIVKIQKTLQELYAENCRRSRESQKEESRDVIEGISGEEEIQACTENSETADCFSSVESAITMFGSWEGDKTHKKVKSSSDTVENATDSVSVFLKYFKNPPKRKEIGLLEAEIDKSRRKNEEDDDSNVYPETPPRASRFPDNLKPATRRNVKHVPSILRRNNGHCEPMETMKKCEKPCRILPPKQRPRTTRKNPPAAENEETFIDPLQNHHRRSLAPDEENHPSCDPVIPPCASSFMEKPNNHQRLEAIRKKNVNFMEMEKASNVRKAKLNFSRSKLGSIPELSSSEDFEMADSWLEKNSEVNTNRKIEKVDRVCRKALKVGNESREFFLRQDHSQTVDFRMELGRRSGINEDREEMPREKITFSETESFLDFGENEERAKAFEESVDKGKKDIDAGSRPRKIQTVISHDDLRDDPEKRLPAFEFPKPKNYRSRREEPDETSEEIVYLRNGEELLRGLNPNEEPGVTDHSKVPETADFGWWRYAEIERIPKRSANENFRTTKILRRADESSMDLPIRGSSLGQNRANPRKPVVLFRPIEENRRRTLVKSEPENPEATTMREAVRNLRVIGFEDSVVNRVSKRSEESWYRQNRLSSRGDRRWLEKLPAGRFLRESSDRCSQPTKFLAYEQPDDRNPRRIPIYDESEAGTNGDPPELLKILDENRGRGNAAIYLRSVELEEAKKAERDTDFLRESRSENFPIANNYSINDDSGIFVRSVTNIGAEERSRRVALMIPHPSRCHCKTSGVSTSISKPLKRLDPTSNDLTPARIVYSRKDCPRPARQASQLRYELAPLLLEPAGTSRLRRETPRYGTKVDFNGRESNEPSGFPDRFQLPDGRIGISFGNNSTVDDRGQPFDENIRRRLIRPKNIDPSDPNPEIGQRVYGFEDREGIVYSQAEPRWNVYGVNEAYRRLSRPDELQDTFPGPPIYEYLETE